MSPATTSEGATTWTLITGAAAESAAAVGRCDGGQRSGRAKSCALTTSGSDQLPGERAIARAGAIRPDTPTSTSPGIGKTFVAAVPGSATRTIHARSPPFLKNARTAGARYA
jgi:hypothetical protein